MRILFYTEPQGEQFTGNKIYCICTCNYHITTITVSSFNDALCSDAVSTEYNSDSEFSGDRGGHTKYYRIYVSLPELCTCLQMKIIMVLNINNIYVAIRCMSATLDIKAFVELQVV